MKRLAGRLRLHSHDVLLVAFVGVTLLGIAGVLGGGGRAVLPDVGGSRRVDLEALTRRIEAGELSAREALWYHAEPAERDGQGRL